MQYSIQRGNVDVTQLAQKLVDRKIKKLETLLVHYQPDLVDLKIKLEKIEDKNIVMAQLVLSLPSQTLRVEKQSKDTMEVLGLVFDTLNREVKKFKDQLRKEHTY